MYMYLLTTYTSGQGASCQPYDWTFPVKMVICNLFHFPKNHQNGMVFYQRAKKYKSARQQEDLANQTGKAT